jgi:hypothetical protein
MTMQATVGAKRSQFGLGWIKNAALGVGLAVGILAGSATAIVASHDTSSAPTQPHASVSMNSVSNYRVREANLFLPGVAPAAKPNYHLIEINQLPEAASPAMTRTTLAQYRFIESNMLPGDTEGLPPTGARGQRY